MTFLNPAGSFPGSLAGRAGGIAAKRVLPRRLAAALLAALVAALVATLAGAGFARAQNTPQVEATSIHIVDAATGTVLKSVNADAPVAPASLTKLMTAELVFEALEAGALSLTQTVAVDEDAWRRGGAPSGGSTMFAALKSEIAVADLLRGMIVQSGNDAAILLARAVAGGEEAFVERMNARAAELGLTASRFGNATGLPAPDAKVTMRDMVALARRIVTAHPERYRVFAEPEFTWNGITQRNRNPVLAATAGADGLMTGFVEASGYSAVASALRGGRRVFVAAAGFPSIEARTRGMRELVDWSFAAFTRHRLYAAGEPLGEAAIYGGTQGRVALAALQDVDVLLPLNAGGRTVAELRFEGPLDAPVTAGAPVGVLSVAVDGEEIASFPVGPVKDVGVGPLRGRALDAVGELAFGWLR